MISHPVRYQILAATLTEAQRRLLRSLPADVAFDPEELADSGPTLAAMRRDGLIERKRLPIGGGAWLRLTHRGRHVRTAAEGMA